MNAQWQDHLDYNKEWQKRNFKIIFLTALVYLHNMFKFG